MLGSPLGPTWWLLLVAIMVGVVMVLPFADVMGRAKRFPPMTYGGRPVPSKYQARAWRGVFAGAVGLAFLGVGGSTLDVTKTWQEEAEPKVGATSESVQFAIYQWEATERETQGGTYSGEQEEELLIPWLLLVPSLVYWWEVIRWRKRIEGEL